MRTTTLQIRLEAAEKDAFGQAADLAGVALSVWVRQCLRERAREELQGAGHSVPFVKPQSD